MTAAHFASLMYAASIYCCYNFRLQIVTNHGRFPSNTHATMNAFSYLWSDVWSLSLSLSTSDRIWFLSEMAAGHAHGSCWTGFKLRKLVTKWNLDHTKRFNICSSISEERPTWRQYCAGTRKPERPHTNHTKFWLVSWVAKNSRDFFLFELFFFAWPHPKLQFFGDISAWVI